MQDGVQYGVHYWPHFMPCAFLMGTVSLRKPNALPVPHF